MSNFKAKRFFVISITLLLVGLGVAIFSYVFFSGSTPSNQLGTEKTKEDSSTITEPVASVPDSEEAPEPPEDLSPGKKRVVEKERQFRKSIAEQANQPLKFYGKVVDQNGRPVHGVRVKGILDYHKGIWKPELMQETFHVRTDANGRFAIKNQEGIGLSIVELRKEGYISKAGNSSYKNHYISPQYEGAPEPPYEKNPVVFKLWKKQEPADLVTGSKRVGGMGADSDELIYINEGFQTVSVPGTSVNLKVRFKVKPKQKTWSVAIKIEDGGIIETDDVYTYEAPRSGYKPVWQSRFKKGEKGYKSQIWRSFYLKANNGTIYGYLDRMSIIPFVGKENGKKTAGLSWDYRINPHGSRNLLGK